MKTDLQKTPYYLLDEAECINRTKCIKKEITAWGGKICYAIKANPFLIPSLLHVVDKFEVCSPGELQICKKYGVPGNMILFSGVVKTKQDITEALAYPVDVITLESLTHWKYLKECLNESTKEIEIVRIMPRLSNGAQFGMEEEQIYSVLEEQKTMEQIKVEGIHYFTGTQKKGNKYEKELKKVAELIDNIRSKYGFEEFVLEYGPGLSVPYFTGDDFTNPYGLIRDLKEFILKESYSFRVDIELGRYIAASCGKYVTNIVDIKKSEERNYCLIDGGIHHINYYGSNMAMRTPVITHVACKDTDEEIKVSDDLTANTEAMEYMICGSLCTFADIVVRGLPLKAPKIGDSLIFENIGAYSITESSYLFLSRNLPGIYMKKTDGQIITLRDEMPSFEINSVKGLEVNEKV